VAQYGRDGSTLNDELNRLANGGGTTYPPYSSYKDRAGAAQAWAGVRGVVLGGTTDLVGVINKIYWTFPSAHAATTASTAGIYLAGTTGADGGTGVGATITAPSNARLVVDGHTISNGERVLYWKNTDARYNGIYYTTDQGSASTKWVITRDTNADNHIAGQLQKNKYIYITNGNTHATQRFEITTTGTGPAGSVVIGTQNINFAVTTNPTYNQNQWLDIAGICNLIAGTTGLEPAAALRQVEN
jgi:hypothetical protein